MVRMKYKRFVYDLLMVGLDSRAFLAQVFIHVTNLLTIKMKGPSHHGT